MIGYEVICIPASLRSARWRWRLITRTFV